VTYKADILIEDSFSLKDYGIEGKIIHTPGHSPGTVSIILGDGRAFVGDMAMSAFPLRLFPGLPIFAEQQEKLKTSWKKIIAAGAEEVYSAHGHNFKVERMRQV